MPRMTEGRKKNQSNPNGFSLFFQEVANRQGLKIDWKDGECVTAVSNEWKVNSVSFYYLTLFFENNLVYAECIRATLPRMQVNR